MFVNNKTNYNTFIGTDTKFNKKIVLNNQDRLRHTLILGSGGSGKFYHSLVPLVKDDIDNNTGVIILDHKSELAEYAAAKAAHSNRNFLYFNPVFENCPKFNPLYGDETFVINTLSNIFENTLSHLPKKLIKFNLGILSRAIKVIKRVYKDDANLIDLYNILYNPKDEGVKILHNLMDIKEIDDVILKENIFICEWFINFYKKGTIEGINTKKYSIALRQEIWSLINNKLLKNCLIPERGTKPDIILKDVLENKTVLCIAINEGHLGDFSKFISHLFICKLRESLNTNKELSMDTTMIYLNHAQHIFNKEIANLIPMCKENSIGLVISAHSPLECQELGGFEICRYIFNNCNTKIIYPYTKDSDYGFLINIIDEKDLFLARYKARSAHYIINNSICSTSGVITIDPIKFDEEYNEIEKLRVQYILENKLLIE